MGLCPRSSSRFVEKASFDSVWRAVSILCLGFEEKLSFRPKFGSGQGTGYGLHGSGFRVSGAGVGEQENVMGSLREGVLRGVYNPIIRNFF